MTTEATQETKEQLLTFAELVQYGREHGANIVNGMPWSFSFNGVPITHENDECYLVGAHQRFTPRDALAVGPLGMLVVLQPVLSAPAPEGRDESPITKEEREFNDCESERFGWDGYQVEDAVGFARLFKQQRDDARAALRQSAADRQDGEFVALPFRKGDVVSFAPRSGGRAVQGKVLAAEASNMHTSSLSVTYAVFIPEYSGRARRRYLTAGDLTLVSRAVAQEQTNHD